MGWLKWLSRNKPSAPAAKFGAAILPDAPFNVVGDIHGRADLLDQALEVIGAVSGATSTVFVGDYVDRGADSAGVLRRLHELQSNPTDQVVCLRGNHEDMMLGFIDDPAKYHRVWLRNGGDATLRSFGIELPDKALAEEDAFPLRDQLVQNLGADLLQWLHELPLSWQSGNVWVTHAGADPLVDMARQDRSALLWGHPDFRKVMRSDDQWIVHGHTIVPVVTTGEGFVSVDTGAYQSGWLPVVRLSNEGVRVLD